MFIMFIAQIILSQSKCFGSNWWQTLNLQQNLRSHHMSENRIILFSSRTVNRLWSLTLHLISLLCNRNWGMKPSLMCHCSGVQAGLHFFSSITQRSKSGSTFSRSPPLLFSASGKSFPLLFSSFLSFSVLVGL